MRRTSPGLDKQVHFYARRRAVQPGTTVQPSHSADLCRTGIRNRTSSFSHLYRQEREVCGVESLLGPVGSRFSAFADNFYEHRGHAS